MCERLTTAGEYLGGKAREFGRSGSQKTCCNRKNPLWNQWQGFRRLHWLCDGGALLFFVSSKLENRDVIDRTQNYFAVFRNARRHNPCLGQSRSRGHRDSETLRGRRDGAVALRADGRQGG